MKDEPKDAVIYVRVTMKEKLEIQEAFSKMGTVSAWARVALMWEAARLMGHGKLGGK
jgi:hypothetical protein